VPYPVTINPFFKLVDTIGKKSRISRLAIHIGFVLATVGVRVESLFGNTCPQELSDAIARMQMESFVPILLKSNF